MAPEKGKTKIWLGLLGILLGVALATWLRYNYLLSQGKPFFWLAELFAPFAVSSVLMVIFVEKLSPPEAKRIERKEKK